MNAKQEDPVLDALQSCAKTLQACAIAFASCAKTAAAALDPEKTKDNCRLTIQCCQSLLELEKVSKDLLSTSVQQSLWQPIHTAPKDGTYIIVCQASDADGKPMGSSLGLFTQRVSWWEDVGQWVDYCSTDPDPECFFAPSHWMPIPPPPTTGGQDETP